MTNFITKSNLTKHCGFCSQMSQYSSLLNISKKTGLQPVFFIENLKGEFEYSLDYPFIHKPKLISSSDINTESIVKIELQRKNKIIDQGVFDLPIEKNKNYDIIGDLGIFHYFKEIRNEILKIYTFIDDIQENCKNFIKQVKEKNEILVSVSFRRGDYLQYSSLNLSIDYFNEAVRVMESIGNFYDKKIKYVIFSGSAYGDDGWSWVKKNFNPKNSVYTQGMDKYNQLCLMSMCDNNIISNSSFAWWGAYLNQNPTKKVICPYNYVNDPNNDYINGNWFPKGWTPINIV